MRITTIITIPNSDIARKMKAKDIKSLYRLSQLSGVSFGYILRAHKGYVAMSQKSWDKIKKHL